MDFIKNYFKKHTWFFCIFLFILFYNLVAVGVNPWNSTNVYYSFYLIDFSFGFCTKILPGAIYNFLFDDTSPGTAYTYNVILFVLLIALVAYILERLIMSFEKENRKTLIFILLFFVSGPLTFSLLAQVPGTYDYYWLLFATLSLLCLSDKKLYIFIIPLSLLAVITNYGYLIVQLPFLLLLMIYKSALLNDEKSRIFLRFIAVITLIMSFSLGLYFVFFENANLVYSKEECVEIFRERGFTGEPDYFLITLYNDDFFNVMENDFDEKVFASAQSPIEYSLLTLYLRIKLAIEKIHIKSAIIPLMLASPCVSLFFVYFRKKVKEERNKTKKLTLLCFIPVSVAVIIFSMFLSMDIIRFIGHSFILLFTSFLYVLYNEKDVEYIRKTIKKVPVFLTLFYIAFYLVTIMSPIE